MKPNAVLGLATGSTPVGLYKQLIEWYNKGDLDFSQITSVNLDEYKGLSGVEPVARPRNAFGFIIIWADMILAAFLLTS